MGKRKTNLCFSSSESLPNRNSQSNSASQSASNSQLSSLCRLFSNKRFRSSETLLEDSPSQLSESKRINRQYSLDEINRLSREDLEEILMSDDSPPKNRHSQFNPTSQSASNSQLSSVCVSFSDKKFKSSKTLIEDSSSQLSESKRINRQYSVDEINQLSCKDLEEILMSDDSPPRNRNSQSNPTSQSALNSQLSSLCELFSDKKFKSSKTLLEDSPSPLSQSKLIDRQYSVDEINRLSHKDLEEILMSDDSPPKKTNTLSKSSVTDDVTVIFNSSRSSKSITRHLESEPDMIIDLISSDDCINSTLVEVNSDTNSNMSLDKSPKLNVLNENAIVNLHKKDELFDTLKKNSQINFPSPGGSNFQSFSRLFPIEKFKSSETPLKDSQRQSSELKQINSVDQIKQMTKEGLEMSHCVTNDSLKSLPKNTPSLPVDGMVFNNVCEVLDPIANNVNDYIPVLDPELILNMPVIFLNEQNISFNEQVATVRPIGENLSIANNQQPDVDHLISNNCNSKSCSSRTEIDVVYDTAPFYSNSDVNSNDGMPSNISGCSNRRPLSTGSNENLNEVQKCLRSRLNSISMNRTLAYKGPVTAFGECTERKSDVLRNRILRIFSKLLVQATSNQPLLLVLRNNTEWSNCVFENKIVKLKRRGKFSVIRSETPKFNLIVYLLGKMSAMVQKNITCTQREVYYLIKDCLGQYYQISSALNIISSMLNIEPWYLPIKSTSKGLVYGALTIFTSDGDVLNCNPCGGMMIPYNVIKITKIISKAYFIMVVEKDSVFKKMIQEDVPNKFTRPFILVTGKGCPDVNTRLFLRILRQHLRVPVFILVDADPYGIDIMLTYKHGSLSMSHVNTHLADPSMQWLGVLPSEIIPLGFERLLLKKFDQSRVLKILNRPYMDEETAVKKELQVLLDNNFKAEIEGLQMGDNSLTDFYLQNKLCNKNFF